MENKKFEIKSFFGFGKPKILEFREDGVLYDGTFIDYGDFNGIMAWQERRVNGYFSDDHYYNISVGGANKSISLFFSESGRKTIKRDIYNEIKNSFLETVGDVIISKILESLKTHGSYGFGNATLKIDGIECTHSRIITKHIIVPEISIKGNKIFVPANRVKCCYDNGMICISDTLHTNLNCRIDPQRVRNAILIPFICDRLYG